MIEDSGSTSRAGGHRARVRIWRRADLGTGATQRYLSPEEELYYAQRA